MFGLRDKYDLVMSIGGTCSVTMVIRAMGMQFLSMPLDWAGGYDIEQNVGALVNDFERFFVPDNLDFERRDSVGHHDVYRDRVSGIGFYHDIPERSRLEDVAPGIVEKYARRALACRERMEKSGTVLLIYTEIVSQTGKTGDEAIVAAWDAAQKRYPNSEIDLLFFHNLPGRDFDGSCVLQLCPHVFKVGFDLAIEDDPESAFVNHAKLIPVLRLLVPGGAVDYRTAEQRRQYVRRKRARKFEQMHAKGWISYVCNRLEYRLFKHFRKALLKRGFSV